MQNGGRTISQNAATRKTAKDKGMISYKMGTTDAPGSEGNKGKYIGFSKQAKKDYASGKTLGFSMKNAKTARPIMQKGGPTPYSIRMSTEPMTPKEKRQSKRNTNATIRYVKKNGSGLKMNTDKTNKGVYQEGGGKNSPFTNPYTNRARMNGVKGMTPIPGSTYQPKEYPESMLKPRPKMEGPMNKPMTPEGWSSENNIETPRMPILYKKTGGATKRMQKGGSNVIQSIRRNMLNNKENRLIDRGVKNMKAGNVEKGRAQFEKSDDVGYKRRHLGDKYKTGGMVNANAKIAAAKKATGRVGGITKAISKVAVKAAAPKGKVGGTSKAPKKALPKAQLGAIMKAGKMLNKISEAPGGKTVIGGGIAAGILGLNKLGSNKSSSKSKGTKAAKSVMSKAFPTISKSKMGGMKGKSC